MSSALLNDIKEEQSFPTNIQDTKFYDIQHEHVGEAIDIKVMAVAPTSLWSPTKTKPMHLAEPYRYRDAFHANWRLQRLKK